MDFSLPSYEEGKRGLQSHQKGDEPDRHQECASQPDLRILRSKECQDRPAYKESQTNQSVYRGQPLARDESHRQLDRHSFTAAVKIDGVGFAAVLIAPLEETDHRPTLVAVDRQQPVPDLDAPSRWASRVDVRNKPGRAVRSITAPASSFLDTVVTGDCVDGEREQ